MITLFVCSETWYVEDGMKDCAAKVFCSFFGVINYTDPGRGRKGAFTKWEDLGNGGHSHCHLANLVGPSR